MDLERVQLKCSKIALKLPNRPVVFIEDDEGRRHEVQNVYEHHGSLVISMHAPEMKCCIEGQDCRGVYYEDVGKCTAPPETCDLQREARSE